MSFPYELPARIQADAEARFLKAFKTKWSSQYRRIFWRAFAEYKREQKARELVRQLRAALNEIDVFVTSSTRAPKRKRRVKNRTKATKAASEQRRAAPSALSLCYGVAYGSRADPRINIVRRWDYEPEVLPSDRQQAARSFLMGAFQTAAFPATQAKRPGPSAWAVLSVLLGIVQPTPGADAQQLIEREREALKGRRKRAAQSKRGRRSK